MYAGKYSSHGGGGAKIILYIVCYYQTSLKDSLNQLNCTNYCSFKIKKKYFLLFSTVVISVRQEIQLIPLSGLTMDIPSSLFFENL